MDPFDEERGEISAQAAALLAALVLAADQFTKWWIRDVVLGEPSVVVVAPFFNLVWVWNTGVSFGMFGNDSAIGPWVLSAFALVVVGVLVWWARNTRETAIRVAVALIAGGAVGNVVDRIAFGAVFDFVDIHVAGYHWPAFNVADAAITLGAALLIAEALIPGLFSRRR